MSHELNLAITLPAQPLLLAVPVLVIIVLLLSLKVKGKRRAKKGKVTALAMASIELSIDLDPQGSERGPIAQGKVNNNVVTIAPRSRKGRKNRAETLYAVKFEAPEAPQFVLTKRVDASSPIVDTGNPKFDAVVVVDTDQPTQLARFMTAGRRAAILRLLGNWPSIQITNREASFTAPGTEDNSETIVDVVCNLVAAAETFDRPSPRPDTVVPETVTDEMMAEVSDDADETPDPSTEAVAESRDELVEAQTAADALEALDAESDDVAVETESEAVSIDASSGLDDLVAAAHAIYGLGMEADQPVEAETGHDVDAGDDETVGDAIPVAAQTPAPTEHSVHGDADSDILTEVRLDEATVLNDLFNSGLDEAGTSARFEQVYQGREVAWTGEILRLGPTDRGRQRIAAFVGSADGENPESGRVVALTAVAPEPVLAAGDVVSFEGTLANLDAAQRLFHVV